MIESIVARTLRQFESSQSSIRLEGLSATLSTFVDFVCVYLYQGLFYSDSSFQEKGVDRIAKKKEVRVKYDALNLIK